MGTIARGLKEPIMATDFFDMPITTNQIKSVLDFLHDGREDRMEKRPGNAARAARDRISIARSNVRVQNGLSRSRDRHKVEIESAAG